jgi:hypothetical protein
VVLGAYRETGLMARVVQRTLCKATYFARGWRYAETVLCRGERVSGQREYGGERSRGRGGNELELNHKSTTFLTVSQHTDHWDTLPCVLLNVIKDTLHADGGTLVAHLFAPNCQNHLVPNPQISLGPVIDIKSHFM